MILPNDTFYLLMIPSNIYNLTPPLPPPRHLSLTLVSILVPWEKSGVSQPRVLTTPSAPQGSHWESRAHRSLYNLEKLRCWGVEVLRCCRGEDLSSTEDLDQVTCGQQPGRSTASRGERWAERREDFVIVVIWQSFNYYPVPATYLDCLVIA